jgi:aspartyl-tRNA(Asn)/glutamyl-tRNA(Gln) amidotransferase subunit A
MSALSTGVAAIADAVGRGSVTATSIIADHLEKAEQSQEALNAYTLLDREGALAAAAAIDSRIEAGEDVGPLAGVPIALKDLLDHAGYPNTAGSSYPTPLASRSATVVDRLEAAGAVIIGRTGLHEYAFGFSSENPWFGPVRNPWNPELSPGGSSGGSAVAVAAGSAAAAIGTDTGGSVRVPAALCGVVGLKVTHGRVPLTGVFPLAPSLDTVGPLARSSNDAARVYEAIAGYDPVDPWSAPQPVVRSAVMASLRGTTIGVPHPWVDLPQTEAISIGFVEARSALAALGARVVDLDLPDLIPSRQIEDIAYPEVALVHRERWRDHPATYGPEVAQRLDEVFATDHSRYVAAQQWRSLVRNTAEEALHRCDFLATPAVAANVKPIGEDEIVVAGRRVFYRPPLSRYSALVNQTGLPAISLPLDRDGVPPPSIQFIGRRWGEHRLLELGSLLEREGISRYRRPAR